jgi:hypothetical protein
MPRTESTRAITAHGVQLVPFAFLRGAFETLCASTAAVAVLATAARAA